MSYRALLTHVVADPGCQSRLAMTASVARVLGAEVIGLGAQAPWPYPDVKGRGSAFEQIAQATRAKIDAAAALFRDAFREASPTSAWRAELGYPDQVIPEHARSADLIVAYPTVGDVDASIYARPDLLVMECGLPMLLMPREERPFAADRILLAWKNTREARRTVSVALPLLKQSGRVMIAAVCQAGEIATVETELSDVAARLARHGIMAATLAEVESPGATGRKLLRIAESDGSDLIVAGAYGHSRLREWVLGGVTRDLLDDGRRYVWLSH